MPSAGFSMVLHPEACWGGLPTRVQKTKIYHLENRKSVTNTCHFQKSIWQELSRGLLLGGKLFGGNFFKKSFGRKFSKKLSAGTISKNNWRAHFGENILAGNLIFFHFENSTKCSFFKLRFRILTQEIHCHSFAQQCFQRMILLESIFKDSVIS
jgi:hypothetical protein